VYRGGHALICRNYREIQQWFLNNMPGFVKNIFLIVYREDNTIYDGSSYTRDRYMTQEYITDLLPTEDGGGTASFSTNDSGYCNDGLSFYDDSEHRFLLYRTINNTGYSGPKAYITSFTFAVNGDNIHRVRNKLEGGDNPNRYINDMLYNGALPRASIIKEIIKINENTVAFTFGHIFSKNPTLMSPGILILTKSNEGNLTLISPSNQLICVHNFKYDGNPVQYGKNYLLVASKNSSRTPYRYDTIPFQSVYGDKTILNPIIINGCTEYCPDCFYVPVSQYIIPCNEDTIISINGEPYYYNGFIAVKIH
jgi:hypothetical protein